jgi:3-hydroxybutyryl-CoA dehydrogenase
MEEKSTMEIKKVGVVGCGVMGSGIVQVCAQSGYQVVTSEINDELLNKGLGSINSILTGRVNKGKLSQQDKDSILGRIKGTTDTKDFSDCDLVIEAVIENMDLKKKVFADLDKICPKNTILASNTSFLPIIDMAMATKRPDQFLGMHFFNPAPVMRLLELVKSIATSDETIEVGKEFGKSIGKRVIVAPDIPGFIVNRQLAPFQIGAVRMLEAGIATKEDIDAGITDGLNMPMGMLTLSDLVGLDTLLEVADAAFEQTKDQAFAAPTLLRKMVAAGWLGRKTGKGFYDYK